MSSSQKPTLRFRINITERTCMYANPQCSSWWTRGAGVRLLCLMEQDENTTVTTVSKLDVTCFVYLSIIIVFIPVQRRELTCEDLTQIISYRNTKGTLMHADPRSLVRYISRRDLTFCCKTNKKKVCPWCVYSVKGQSVHELIKVAPALLWRVLFV